MSPAGIAAGFSTARGDLFALVTGTEQANIAARKAWFAWAGEQFPDLNDMAISQLSIGGRRYMEGVVWPGGRDVPEMWRRPNRSANYIVPRRSKAAEKELAKSMAALPPIVMSPELPGMWRGLQMANGMGLRIAHPQFIAVDGEVWALWSMDPDRSDVAGEFGPDGSDLIDESIWTRRKLSEVIAAVEVWEAR